MTTTQAQFIVYTPSLLKVISKVETMKSNCLLILLTK